MALGNATMNEKTHNSIISLIFICAALLLSQVFEIAFTANISLGVLFVIVSLICVSISLYYFFVPVKKKDIGEKQ